MKFLIALLVAFLLTAFSSIAPVSQDTGLQIPSPQKGERQQQRRPHYTQVKIGTTTVDAVISATDAEQIRGLQFKKKLEANEGMLFIYQPDKILTHWMKDMLIPLDMIWMDKNKKIINISANVPVCQTPPCAVYSSEQPAEYVLEVNAGFADQHKIKPGMTMNFSLI